MTGIEPAWILLVGCLAVWSAMLRCVSFRLVIETED